MKEKKEFSGKGEANLKHDKDYLPEKFKVKISSVDLMKIEASSNNLHQNTRRKKR